MTYIVALTGGIGSGKTTVSNRFEKIGINIIDSDVITKKIIKYDVQIFYSITKKFGKKILNLDQSINRLLLREYIFSNKNYRIWLENLLHPKVYQETKNQIKLIKSSWCIWVTPLLIEKKLEKRANRILLIDTSVKNQIKRIVTRDTISIQDAKKIISLQATRKQRISLSDDIISNVKEIKKINIYVCYFNKFYSYLAKNFKNEKNKNIKKNYLTKFY
ncbi:dephospho-CoA kinase [Buchnera aphidicola]|uniref:Dephospho-CoA kinase n=1 Tax=Buchnera aphidicola (Artemisaphis artemisicola) TaxID=1241836 RepID=A0A4D6XIB7_9GAMM|nr:dephospho-CoA kinase [Buchnera aphidicola]QCI15893.1 dephospho-CoA kinase [Buchnera aphidicola (Artemisaphis artemisicola)]